MKQLSTISYRGYSLRKYTSQTGKSLAALTICLGLIGCQGVNRIPVQQKKTEKELLREQYEKMQQQAVKAKADAARAKVALDEAQAALAACQNKSSQKTASASADKAIDQEVEQIDGVEIMHSPGKVTMRMQGDILFSPGKVELKTGAQDSLKKVAAEIKKKFTNNMIRVEGYSDKTKITKSKWKDNLELSLQRAAAVHRFLQKQGVNASQMYASGFGATQLRKTDSLSRRVEIVVLEN